MSSNDSERAEAVYRERIEARIASEQDLAARGRRIGDFRLAAAVMTIAMAWVGFRSAGMSAAWTLLPVVAFIALVAAHDQTRRARRRAASAIDWYARGLERIENRWAGRGATGIEFVSGDHPYAIDLDLFGDGSLFQLLSGARTQDGERLLADWLLHPSSAEQATRRQAAVLELAPALDLREELAVRGVESGAVIHAHPLRSWGAARPALTSRAIAPLAIALPALAMTSLILFLGGWLGPGVAAAAIALEAAYLRRLREDLRHVVGGVDRPVRDLDQLVHALEVVEQADFASDRLRQLQRVLIQPSPVSTRVARLDALLFRLDQQRNILFAPIAFLVLWPVHFALAIERWRRTNGTEIGRWLDALGEIEALAALAAYAYEHDDDPMPEFVAGHATFVARDLGHPLIDPSDRVRNDVSLTDASPALVVSGSNMSGKSTLLRTVGINAVLAMAGAPVSARSLTLSPVAIGATLRIQDSIQRGTSRFYAELERLRQLDEAARGAPPLLFLLDELLAGTNSEDRRSGARALLIGFLDRGAIGLVTTHDLAITEVATDLERGVRNVHFEDRLEGDRLVFDFRLRDGIVTTSNALGLMRALGFRIDEQRPPDDA